MRTKEQNAERMRKYRASLTSEAKTAAYERKKSCPSRVDRSTEYKSRFGEEWLALDDRPFVGVDGEGGEWNGIHAYGCLTVGEVTFINEDGSPLSSRQCLDYLTSLSKYARYVGFFLGYDWTLIFRDLSVKDQAAILRGRNDEEGRLQPVWVDGGRYGITYIPKKFCKIVRTKNHPDGPGSVTVYDTSSYFQCAFSKALEDWDVGTEEERELIRRTKEERQHFVLPIPPATVEYNLLECKLLAEMITKMVTATQELGITIRSYHGPATLSTALFEREGVEKRMGKAPETVQALFASAYFGGRFETSAVGIAGEVYEYDIASAYPAAMVTLSCQTCGEWWHNYAYSGDCPTTLCHVSWSIEQSIDRPFTPLPWRSPQGSLFYPTVGSGWYWQEEVAAAQRAFPGQVHVDETWSYVTECSHTPFAWMSAIYDERKRLGKSTAGRVLKLAMNSAYGVLARTIGGGGRYSNSWWAGQVTARTRARLLDLACSAGPDCLMLATDGLYASRPLAIPTGTQLGDWEDGGQVGPLLIVQPGLYLSTNPNGKKWRTRGVSLKTLKRTDGVNRLVDAWRQDGPEATVEVSAAFLLAGEDEPTVFIGTKLALAWGKPELIGTWQPLSKTISFRPEPRRKRVSQSGFVHSSGEYGIIRTLPPAVPLAALLDSAPYKKLAKMNEAKALAEVQPYQMGIGL